MGVGIEAGDLEEGFGGVVGAGPLAVDVDEGVKGDLRFEIGLEGVMSLEDVFDVASGEGEVCEGGEFGALQREVDDGFDAVGDVWPRGPGGESVGGGLIFVGEAFE